MWTVGMYMHRIDPKKNGKGKTVIKLVSVNFRVNVQRSELEVK